MKKVFNKIFANPPSKRLTKILESQPDIKDVCCKNPLFALGALSMLMAIEGCKCETCKYYNGACSCPKMNYSYCGSKNTAPDAVDIIDEAGWGMEPGPEFCCKHYEDKDV